MTDNTTQQFQVNEVSNIRQELSGLYCRATIDSHEIILSNIRNVEYRQWIFDDLPRLILTFRDDHLFFNLSTIKESSVLTLLIGTSEEDTNKKEYKFKIFDHQFSKVNDVATVTILGHLDISQSFFEFKNRAFAKSTSLDVVKRIARESNLGFNSSNGLQTADAMTWIQCSSNQEFLNYLSEKAYITGDTPLIYTDLDGNLNFRGLKLELNDASNIPTRLDYRTEMFTMLTPDGIAKYKLDNKLPDKSGHFYSYTIKNMQTYLDNLLANGIRLSYIDYDTMNKFLEVLDKKTYPMLTNKSNFKEYEGSTVFQSIISSIRTDNVYTKFFSSPEASQYNLASFFSQVLFTNVNYLCELNLMDKVDLRLPSFLPSDANGTVDMNIPYSGTYLVGGIYVNFKVSQKTLIPTRTVALFRPGVNNPEYPQ